MSYASDIRAQISAYGRKWQLQLGAAGLLRWLLVVAVFTFSLLLLEWWFRFGSGWRTVFFYSWLVASLFLLGLWVVAPLVRLRLRGELAADRLAQRIGRQLPEVDDRLYNWLVLQRQVAGSPLVAASLKQRQQYLAQWSFPGLLRWSELRKGIIPLLAIALAMFLVGLLRTDIYTESSERLLRHSQSFTAPAPFSLSVDNQSLTYFQGDDISLVISASGSAFPSQVVARIHGTPYRGYEVAPGQYEVKLSGVQRGGQLALEAGGYSFGPYALTIISRPASTAFQVEVVPPAYTGQASYVQSNNGHLQVPEGSSLFFRNQARATEELWLDNRVDSLRSVFDEDDGLFTFDTTCYKSGSYGLVYQGAHPQAVSKLAFGLEVIPDEHPRLQVQQFPDSSLYTSIMLGGYISDDYGLSKFGVEYKRLNSASTVTDTGFIGLPIKAGQARQSFFHAWDLKSLQLDPGDKLRFRMVVYDNDGINGPKATRSTEFYFALPSRQEQHQQLSNERQKAAEDIARKLESVTDFREAIQAEQERLKGKEQLDWQDRKQLEDLVEMRQELEQEIQQLKEQMEDLGAQQEQLGEMSPELREKMKQLEELMQDLMDDETKELYEELQRLLEEEGRNQDIQEMLQDIDLSEEKLQEELERSLELFKRMKLEMEMQELSTDLQELADQQEQLQESAEEKTAAEMSQEQQEINEQFDQLRQEMEQMQQDNQELKRPFQLPQDQQQQMQETEQELQKSKEQLDQNQPSEAQPHQERAKQNLQQMAQQMQQMSAQMQQMQMTENMDDLRQILDNLLTLSFDQERIMKEYRQVRRGDPRYNELAQAQLKLQDDAQVVEDSLQALAQRVFQIETMVTDQVNDMNRYMEQASESIKERNQAQAAARQQQAMTSMNNLALLLDDVLGQMQQAMSQASGMPSDQPQEGNTPSMSQLQQQLSQQIQQLKQQGTQGRQLSEQLAEMAARQEAIRRQLEEARQKMQQEGGMGGDQLQELLQMMEDNEEDLVNKRLTQQLIERQKEINKRLLQAEDAMRQQELDEQREGETATEYEKRRPAALDEYIRQKQQEIELLRTIPLRLNTFYKSEANKYFERLNQP